MKPSIWGKRLSQARGEEKIEGSIKIVTRRLVVVVVVLSIQRGVYCMYWLHNTPRGHTGVDHSSQNQKEEGKCAQRKPS